MPELNVVVSGVFPPKPGKKRWSIKASDGALYGAMPPLAQKIQNGGEYKIEYKNDEFNGIIYRVIEKVTPISLPATPVAPLAPAAHAAPTRYSGTDDKTAERIFVCGAVNACMGNQNINPLAMTDEWAVNLVDQWRGVWKQTFGATTAPKTKLGEEMQDEIAF